VRGRAKRWVEFALWAVAIAATSWTFLATGPLPLVDLPQHEAQVSILRHWDDPGCGYPAAYEIHPFSPYWLAYVASWALSYATGVELAVRWTLLAALLAIPIATRRAVSVFGGVPEWAIAVFPFLCATATVWGFFSFVVAVPLVVALLPAFVRQVKEPGLARGLIVGFAAAALFFAHAVAMIYALLLFALLAATVSLRPRELLRRLWPALLAVPCPLFWWWSTSRGYGSVQGRTSFLLGSWRVTDLAAELTAIRHRGWALAALVAVLAALWLAGARPSRDRLRWAPFGATLVLVVLGPHIFFGTSMLASRFTIFLVPTLLLALDRRAPVRFSAPGPSCARRALPALVALALVALQAWRFAAIEREGAGLGEVLAEAPAGRRLLFLNYDRGSRHAREPVFLHSGMRYAVDRCGFAERSMAIHFQLPIRFRPGAALPLPSLLEYTPQKFKWDKHGGERFDLVLVRDRNPPDPARLAGAPGRLALRTHRERWWLFERISPAPEVAAKSTE
jgi:hypothetical protein